jgi:dipeptidyl aminopeptidase/acylaminoacyl peptidase
LRYADLLEVGPDVWCVRERHRDGVVDRHLVAVALDGSLSVRELVGGSDFLAHPRVSPDGTQLAWLAWDHPRMPWEGTELRVAPIDEIGGIGPVRTVLGGPAESVLQPEWADDDNLYAITDRSDWWNLVRVPAAGGDPVPLHPLAEEFGAPLWGLGQRTYADLGGGRLAVVRGTGQRALGILDTTDGSLRDLDLPFTRWASSVSALDGVVLNVVGSPLIPTSLVRINLDPVSWELIAASSAHDIDAGWLPVPTIEALPGPHGRVVHAVIYPPTSPTYAGPEGESPPYIVFVHGGPTSQAMAAQDIEKAFFTSRGVGIIDVNHGGSTGYGRAYRDLLREAWGVVDVEDCVAAAQALAAAGRADPARLVIRGGSAGGWTVLSALTQTDAFAAGTSYFGVAELLRFTEDTHDFESRYNDYLIGPLPEQRQRYIDRAPLSHVDDLSCPVLLLQGDQDLVVPPSQSEMFRDALLRKHIPHAYILFAGEGHGFRKAATIIAALSAELSFYGQVLGFDPPGIPRLELTTGD